MWLSLPICVLLITAFKCTFGDDVLRHNIAYHVGTLPIIIGAPHAGGVKPEDVPDRDAGCWDGRKCIWSHRCGKKDTRKCEAVTIRDSYTKELSMQLRDELYKIYGQYPHLIVCEVHRSKMDANRKIDEATFGVRSMVDAWSHYHMFIDRAKAASGEQPSLYLDIHGHSHSLQWAELGYLLTGSRLNCNCVQSRRSSIRRLAANVRVPFNEILRGNLSFGGILENEGYEAVPSASKPRPNRNPYCSGGINVRMHGSADGGNTDAIQIESPSSFRSRSQRSQYAAALARTIQKYMHLYFGLDGHRRN